jgi:hypothetical protein
MRTTGAPYPFGSFREIRDVKNHLQSELGEGSSMQGATAADRILAACI